MVTQHPTNPNCYLYEDGNTTVAVHKSSELGQAIALNSGKVHSLFAAQKKAFIKAYGQEAWDRPNLPTDQREHLPALD